ncbi:MAG TPA: outer membrane beta-barrel protein, partial [Flavobacterium sp.]|nr:outer membrane beta-barrel protein [Flavobacterium sp.]
NWSLRSGLHYQIMGTEYYNSPGWTTERLDYLTLPAHANIHFGKKKNWNAHFGPSFSFLLNAESDNGSHINQNLESEIKDFQLGFGFGIGHKIQLNDFMALGLQYNHVIGLTAVNRYSTYDYYNDYYHDYYYGEDDIRNNFGSFTVSLIFKLGSKSRDEK